MIEHPNFNSDADPRQSEYAKFEMRDQRKSF